MARHRIARASTLMAFVATICGQAQLAAALTLDPADPSNFTSEGTQDATAGSVLTLLDTSVSDFISFFAADSDAQAGNAVDVVATFQVLQTAPNNVDTGNRVVISDGWTSSAIAASIILNGVRGIGLLSQGPTHDPASYPVFVPVDWQAAPVTIRLRRTATGDAELVEIDGVAPNPRALLTSDQLPGPTHLGFPSVEFGAASVEGQSIVAYSAFRSEHVVPEPAAGSLLLALAFTLVAALRQRP